MGRDVLEQLDIEVDAEDHRGAGGLCREAAVEIRRLRKENELICHAGSHEQCELASAKSCEMAREAAFEECIKLAKRLAAEKDGPEYKGFAMAGYRLGLDTFAAIAKRILAKGGKRTEEESRDE